jgi:hypothetical protein
VVIDGPSDILQFVSAVFGDNLIQLSTGQCDLYHRRNADKWKIFIRFLKVTYTTIMEIKKALGLILFIGQAIKR